jgi:excisionase family DNA binding protein
MSRHLDMSTNLLSGRELAARLGLSPDTIRRWAAEGRIPSLLVASNRRRFDWDSVIRVLAEPPRHEPKEASHAS